MLRFVPFALLALVALAPGTARAQGNWRPPSREMPQMPRVSELGGDWISPRQAWFSGVEGVAGVPAARLRATGEPRPGSDVTLIVRFSDGPLPVVVWSDLGGDTRADRVEIFRRGGIIIQLIDADWDGQANVLRVYDASGKLLREDRM